MKNKLSVLVAVLIFGNAFAQEPCIDGFSGIFPCNNVDRMGYLSVEELGGELGVQVNDIWGWTDSSTGVEYALVGKTDGMAIVDISDPVNPVYVGTLPTHTTASPWRDVKVIGNYAYIGAEANGHGLQIFDLTQLAGVTNPPVVFEETAHYDGYGNSHNTVACEASNFIYAVGSDTFQGGPHFVDVSDPLNPVTRGGFGDQFYCHDAQVVVYQGPDEDYQGKEIYFGCHGGNAEAFVIADFTDKEDPILINAVGYENHVYSHQGWLTPDHKYFLLNDEIDESTFGFNTRTRIFDVQDLDNPISLGHYEAAIPVIDHNLYTRGNYAFLSNYTGGLRIYDISDIENMNIFEEAYFDVHPWDDGVSFSGSWSNFPYFESGNVVVTHRTDGLYIVKPTSLDLVSSIQDIEPEIEVDLFPNPTSDFLQVNADISIESYTLVDELGRVLISKSVQKTNNLNIDLSDLSIGIYFLTLNDLEQGIKVIRE